MEIRFFDLLVHPDHAATRGYDDLPRELELRKLWDMRIKELADKKDAVLFYFPAVGVPEREKPTNLQAFEADRRNAYEGILGERFFCLDYFPHTTKLLESLRERGFTYQPSKVDITAYGEILEQCVYTWLTATRKTLQVSYWFTQRLPELSLSLRDEGLLRR